MFFLQSVLSLFESIVSLSFSIFLYIALDSSDLSLFILNRAIFLLPVYSLSFQTILFIPFHSFQPILSLSNPFYTNTIVIPLIYSFLQSALPSNLFYFLLTFSISLKLSLSSSNLLDLSPTFPICLQHPPFPVTLHPSISSISFHFHSHFTILPWNSHIMRITNTSNTGYNRRLCSCQFSHFHAAHCLTQVQKPICACINFSTKRNLHFKWLPAEQMELTFTY